MSWTLFPISAAFIWAVVNVIDKHLLTKHFKEPLLFIFFGGVIGLSIILVIPFIDFFVPTMPILLLSLAAGVISIFAYLFYFNSLKLEEVSRVIAFWQLTPIFIFFISYFTLGENFSFNQAGAFATLVIGGILVAMKFDKERFYWSRIFFLMLLSGFLYSVSYVVAKYIFLQTNFLNGFIWIRLGEFAAVLPLILIPGTRLRIFKALKDKTAKIKILFVGNESLAFGGMIIYYFAITLAPIALAESLLSFQPLIVLIISVILSLKFKNILEEKLDFRNLLVKIGGILLVAGGLIFLY